MIGRGRQTGCGVALLCVLAFAFGAVPAMAETEVLPGVIANWNLDAGDGKVAPDASGKGHTLTLNGAVWAEGRFGKGLTFADKAYATVPGWKEPGLAEQFSVAAWVKFSKLGQGRQKIVYCGENQQRCVNFSMGKNEYADKIEFRFTTGGEIRQITSATILKVNTWYHVAVTYNGSHMCIYINGKEDSSGKAAGKADGDVPLSLGTIGGSDYFQGSMDEVQIYGRALSAAEVAQMAGKAQTTGAAAEPAPVRKVLLTPGGAATALLFDCGPKEQQAAPGSTSLSGQDTYSPEQGYGWIKEWGFDAATAGTAPKTTVLGSSTTAREHVDAQPEQNDVTFRADVPNGVYAVTIWVGDASPREGRLGTCVATNGRAVLPPPGVGGWGVVTERTLPAVVEDGALLLNFYVVGKGGAARLAVLGFKIEPVTAPEKEGVLRKKWLESEMKGEKPREVKIGEQTFMEVGRRREIPLGALSGSWQGLPLLVFTRSNPGDILDYSIPRKEEVTERLGAFAAPDEDQPLWFGIHALRDLRDVRVVCSDLKGAAGEIPAREVEMFTQTTRLRSMSDRPGSSVTFASDLLEQNMPIDVAKGQSQPIYLRIHVPSRTAAGFYSGVVTLTAEDTKQVELPLSLRVLPITLQSPQDKVWHLATDGTRWTSMTQPQWRAEIDDMARHGINSLEVGYPPFGVTYIEQGGRIVDSDLGVTGEILQYAAQRGMKGPVIVGATPGIFWRCRGWGIGQKGAATHEFTAGQEGRALLLKHADADARSGVDQLIGALLPPGETVGLEVRYQVLGGGSATADLTFWKTHKRDAVAEGRVTGTLKAGEGWQTFSAVTRVPQDALYGRVSISFSGGPGSVLIDEVRLVREGKTVNQIINPGFERDLDIPSETAEEWPELFARDFVDAIRALGRGVERVGSKAWIEGTDEASGTLREVNEMRGAHASGLPTYCNLNPAAIGKMGKDLDTICLYSSFLGTEENCGNLLTTYHSRNQKLFFIASGAYVGQEFDFMPNRHSVGLCFWKSKADGTHVWTYQRPSGDPFNDLDGGVKDYCMVLPPRAPGGKPVPTLGWEGIREGWRDFKYVYTLEQSVAQAEKDGRAEAAGMGRTVLSFIRDTVPWFDQSGGVGYDNASADQLRWLAAWATLEVQEGKGAATAFVAPAGVKPLDVKFASAPPATAVAPLLCAVTAEAPVLDGRLEDPLWAKATKIDGLKSYLDANAAARQKTEIFLTHDAANLYIGFRCFEPAMDQVKATVKELDGNVFADDSIELFLDTANDEFNFFQLAFNVDGTRFDMRCAGDNNAGANVFGANYAKQKVRDVKWNGEWSVKTSRQADRWEAEVVLPFKTFGRESDLWGINLCRNRKAAEPETSAWRAFGSFHQPQKFGKLLLTGARGGKSTITQVSLPLTRFGLSTAELRLSGGQGLQARTEVTSKSGPARRFDGTAVTEGVARLPYNLDESATALTYLIEENGAVRHCIRMPAEVPSPIGVMRGQKVLSTAMPRGVFQMAIQLSEQEQTQRRFQVTLSGPDGKVIDQAELPLSGAACSVSLNLDKFPQGTYAMTLALTGPKGSTPIERREAVVLVPPFLAEKK